MWEVLKSVFLSTGKIDRMTSNNTVVNMNKDIYSTVNICFGGIAGVISRKNVVA